MTYREDSIITKEFIKRIFNATHKSSYIPHAVDMVKSEKDMSVIIDYLKDNPDASWQDIEYKILMLN